MPSQFSKNSFIRIMVGVFADSARVIAQPASAAKAGRASTCSRNLGAFGIFQRDRVIQVGGFRTHLVGEDLDLVIRMHRRLQGEHHSYHIDCVPDPTGWAEARTDLKSLARQTLAQKSYRSTLAQSRYAFSGRLRTRRSGWAFATLSSIGSVLLEEMTFRRYSDWPRGRTLPDLLPLRTDPDSGMCEPVGW
jgi:cellulose synthase/poly-beta-1,6-N-acetylglucosamine synthase-like glycosyltransferase